MLNPLTVDEAAAAAAAAAESGAAPSLPQQQQQQPGVPATGGTRSVSGWELRLVMEYCDQVCLVAQAAALWQLRSYTGTCAPAAVAALVHAHCTRPGRGQCVLLGCTVARCIWLWVYAVCKSTAMSLLCCDI
jgi:hypothetical protein